MIKIIEFYTDGSAHPNPGPGGYGIIGVENNNIFFVRSKQFEDSKVTNNEMEMKAILYVMLNYGKFKPSPIVYSDSSYCVNTFNQWMFSWANNNWMKSDKKKPENLELVQTYYDLYLKGYRIILKKVKGHVGEKYNELADKLATGKIKENGVLMNG